MTYPTGLAAPPDWLHGFYDDYSHIGSNDVKSPDYEDPHIARMRVHWKVIAALRSTRKDFLRLGREVLPQFPEENPAHYHTRLSRAHVIPFYTGSVSRLASLGFREPLQITGELDGAAKITHDNFDGQGSSLTGFAACVMLEAIHYGLVPVTLTIGAEQSSTIPLEQRRAVERGSTRATFSMIDPRKLLRLRAPFGADGRRHLAHLAWIEQVTDDSDVDDTGEVFGADSYLQITQLTPGLMRRWRKEKSKADGTTGGGSKWEEMEPKRTPEGLMPAQVLFLEKDDNGFLLPPMQTLLDLQLLHFQAYANFRDLTHFLVPMLELAGYDDAEGKNIAFSPRRILRSSSPQAAARFVNFDPGALSPLREELQDIKADAQVEGMAPLLEAADARTAREVEAGENRSMSRMQSWNGRLETFVEELFSLASESLAGFQLPEDFAVSIVRPRESDAESDAKRNHLMALYREGVITAERLLIELQQSGLFSKEFNPEMEARSAQIASAEASGGAPGIGALLDDADEPQDLEPGEEGEEAAA